ncbi:myosin heavy chain, cardiac muscle isoform-like isoform X1 [Dendropsophus ebraccatus]|uniref:myosin heavy chain, cardiac muscle isoform-like isoform X1 n=1 Tax=Dendropsophus ebraccatus TaxID=150705 RepID=UPI0038313DB5
MTTDFPELRVNPYHGAMEAGDSDLLEIEGRCCRLRQQNADLQDALGKADTEVRELSHEIASLREMNKSLQKEMGQFMDLKKQVETLKFKVNQNEEAADIENQLKKDKERRCQQMIERVDQLLTKFDHSQGETVVLKKEVNRLRNQGTSLEEDLQKKRLELQQKQELAEEKESITICMTLTLNEYASTIEVLTNKINALQSKVTKSSQDFFMRTMEESSKLTVHPPDDGTLMHEILRARLDEERLEQTEQEKKWGFLGLRLLYTLMLKILWCNIKVAFFSGFFILFLHYLLQLFQDKGLVTQSVFSSGTIELMEHVLQLFLQPISLGLVPT